MLCWVGSPRVVAELDCVVVVVDDAGTVVDVGAVECGGVVTGGEPPSDVLDSSCGTVGCRLG